ncbi:hypothetical protein VTK56DRAFT_3473 [Thermocarpiscus australiensis]
MNRAAFARALSTMSFRQPLLTRPLGIGARAASSITEPSFWKSMVPKPFRSSTDGTAPTKPKAKKEWNPATFFIFIFLMIGSMSIQMISLKKDFATFMRQSEVRIGLLREVVEKLQKGEKVDVEQVLGTGDPEKELAWEEVLKEIEREDATKGQRKRQQEPTQTPSPKPETSPATEAPQGRVQSVLASKGFY